MTLKNINKISYLLLLIVLLVGCKESVEQKYKAFEKTELAKAIRKDSLFLGLYFQMSKDTFRSYCFDMNIKGKFKQGGNKNMSWVESKIEGTNYPAAINFYPNFKNEKISELNAAIYYKNAKFKDGKFEIDSLMLDVLKLLDTWYDGKVFKIKSPFFYKEDVQVMVDGNKRITITPDAIKQMVNLWYVDLTTLKAKKND
tara:strand:- start:52848 stop:53444 length:597 start_codon:yes stop_codon:yes gene_type:complete